MNSFSSERTFGKMRYEWRRKGYHALPSPGIRGKEKEGGRQNTCGDAEWIIRSVGAGCEILS